MSTPLIDEAQLHHLLAYLQPTELATCCAVNRLWHSTGGRGALWAAAVRRSLSARRGEALVPDPVSAGGCTLQGLFPHARTRWPSSISLAALLPQLKVEAVRPAGADVRAPLLRVRYIGGVGGDRSVVANHAFPPLYRGRGTPESARHTVPFVWAPATLPVSQSAGDATAVSTGGGEGGAPRFVGPLATATPVHDAAPARGSTACPPPTPALAAPSALIAHTGPVRLAGAYVVAYFEVTVEREMCAGRVGPPGPALTGAAQGMRVDHKPWPSRCVAVGLATKKFKLAGRMPGWDAHSYAYHGDDGHRYHSVGLGRPYAVPFGEGDTVGCGLVYLGAHNHAPSVVPMDETGGSRPGGGSAAAAPRLNPDAPEAWWRSQTVDACAASWPHPAASGGVLFFTKNGLMLGPAFAGVDVTRRWYPTIGLDTPFPVTVNFGASPFAFDVRRFNALLLARAVTPKVALSRVVEATVQTGGGVHLGSTGILIAPRPPALGRPRSKSAGGASAHGTPPRPGWEGVRQDAASPSPARERLVHAASPAHATAALLAQRFGLGLPALEARARVNAGAALRSAGLHRRRLRYRPPPSPAAQAAVASSMATDSQEGTDVEMTSPRAGAVRLPFTRDAGGRVAGILPARRGAGERGSPPSQPGGTPKRVCSDGAVEGREECAPSADDASSVASSSASSEEGEWRVPAMRHVPVERRGVGLLGLVRPALLRRLGGERVDGGAAERGGQMDEALWALLRAQLAGAGRAWDEEEEGEEDMDEQEEEEESEEEEEEDDGNGSFRLVADSGSDMDEDDDDIGSEDEDAEAFVALRAARRAAGLPSSEEEEEEEEGEGERSLTTRTLLTMLRSAASAQRSAAGSEVDGAAHLSTSRVVEAMRSAASSGDEGAGGSNRVSQTAARLVSAVAGGAVASPGLWPSARRAPPAALSTSLAVGVAMEPPGFPALPWDGLSRSGGGRGGGGGGRGSDGHTSPYMRSAGGLSDIL